MVKRLNNLFTANGKYNHVTISYVWQSVYTVFHECFNQTARKRMPSLLNGEGSKPQENALISPNSQMESFFRPNWKLKEGLFVA